MFVGVTAAFCAHLQACTTRVWLFCWYVRGVVTCTFESSNVIESCISPTHEVLIAHMTSQHSLYRCKFFCRSTAFIHLVRVRVLTLYIPTYLPGAEHCQLPASLSPRRRRALPRMLAGGPKW
jgi:hypothetical protein